jgi:hypothetical protein
MFLTQPDTNDHSNAYIPASQKHVGKELVTEITQNFTEGVVYIVLTKRRN